jgi:Dyp-type peroxidase family
MLERLQGNVLAAYGTHHAIYLFARVLDRERARSWLATEWPQVTTHEGWEDARLNVGVLTRPTYNIAFSYNGLLALGVPPGRIEHLTAFREGMAARATDLGDVTRDASTRWSSGLADNDMLIVLTAHEPAMLASAAVRLRETLYPDVLEVVHEQQAQRLPKGGEHFGFGDGFSQPAVVGMRGMGPRVGEGTRTRWGIWRRLAVGEFILGNRDGGGMLAPAPLGRLADDATFMVVSKLSQDVAGFRRYVQDSATRLHRSPAWVGAKMVGRWQNGSSLDLYPDAPGPPARRDPEASSFRYKDDPDGFRCPVGAHVRRANPRGLGRWQGRLTQRHRIIRRGMTYGPPLPAEANDDDGQPRGLMFISYQAEIERQFEFLQSQWLRDGNSLRLGSARDPLLGPGEQPAEMVIPGRPPVFLTGIPAFVTTLGGGYYLLPGTSGLEALAAGTC